MRVVIIVLPLTSVVVLFYLVELDQHSHGWSIGLADDPSKSKEGTQTASHSNSGSSKGLNALYISIGVVAVILLAREEQHARLLRLFEEDDELELELGLRD
ncbi:unnamed protein product [Spirodela intermedia]|uniref:Uncharacterized protein n=1 Tax=Spirodela intermedia TaxID=51605 RepID=A0A7I8J111_SPIIN|nr:unnamed protein product [Spirodela intermedia]CAA6663914.1 unnamed protein product [Spirodela intermedia]